MIKIVEVENFNICDFDPAFLHLLSGFLSKLTSISKETVNIDDLKCIVYEDQMPMSKSVEETPAYRYLANLPNDFLTYEQKHNFREDNKSRLENIYNSIKDNGYPFDNKYIILLGNENYVRDGQHRIACLKMLGYKNIEILRFHFSDNSVAKMNFAKIKKTGKKPKIKEKRQKRFINIIKNYLSFYFYKEN